MVSVPRPHESVKRRADRRILCLNTLKRKRGPVLHVVDVSSKIDVVKARINNMTHKDNDEEDQVVMDN